jgi:hypothetical protein
MERTRLSVEDGARQREIGVRVLQRTVYVAEVRSRLAWQAVSTARATKNGKRRAQAAQAAQAREQEPPKDAAAV